MPRVEIITETKTTVNHHNRGPVKAHTVSDSLNSRAIVPCFGES